MHIKLKYKINIAAWCSASASAWYHYYDFTNSLFEHNIFDGDALARNTAEFLMQY